jgi:hypothetical protein
MRSYAQGTPPKATVSETTTASATESSVATAGTMETNRQTARAMVVIPNMGGPRNILWLFFWKAPPGGICSGPFCENESSAGKERLGQVKGGLPTRSKPRVFEARSSAALGLKID